MFAAGAAGVAGLVEAFKGVYQEAREAQKTTAQTNAVIKSTGGVARVSASHVGDLATAISNKVGVDDEAIQSGANLLLTFTRVRNEAGKGNKIFDRATQTVTDMAAAMNNGKVTTDGLKTASIQVGKALNDPLKGITALTKVGVTFDAGQKKQIATLIKHHDTLGAQKIILGELNKEFGGSAAAGTTASQKLGVVFGNIEETIGTALLPAVDKVSSWLSATLPGALNIASRIAGPVFKTIGDGFGGLAAAFSGEGITSDGFVGVMERIGDEGRKVVEFAKTTIIPGFAALADAFSGKNVTSDGFIGVMGNIGDIGRQVVDYINKTIVPNIATAFGSVKTKIAAALTGVDLSAIGAEFVQQAKTWGVDIITGVKTGLATGDWSGLGRTIGTGIISAIGAHRRLGEEHRQQAG
jgi:acid phosphatase family membrane protein YuiD